ncbi:MAG: hypothetical protein L3J32_00780 [Rhizobiaceae bacterium]|nr:hypothetical protein [Rhizobiaceae bacterium]
MIKTLFQRFATGLIILWSLTGLDGQAFAEVTQWEDLGGGRARLVTVFNPQSGEVEGIIEVELKPGWTTYWRQPGEGGIPPDFNFSDSQGVVVETPEFPAPKAKRTFGVISIIYTDYVAFPFKARPVISPLSGKLKLNILMGVCEAICIPAVASFTQDLSLLNKSDPISSSLIELAKQKIPVTKATEGVPQILDAERIDANKVLVRASVSQSFEKPELFAEGKQDWFFSPAKLLRHEGELAEFEVDLSDLPKDADLSATPLRLTLAVDGFGSEQTLFVGNGE